VKQILLVYIILTGLLSSLEAQTKAELEERRKKALSEISYVDELLKSTAREKDESMNAVKIIGKKLNLRESVISDMRQEIDLLTGRIELNTLAIDMMERDLQDLKNDYARAVLNSYKSQKLNTEIIYVLSAKDFNQGYKRLKYLQQIAKYRRAESEVILELKGHIETSKLKLQKDLYRISDLKGREEQQKSLLLAEQENEQKIIKSLSKKEKQLRAELDEKRRVARKIEAEIARIIEAERKKSAVIAATPEQRLIGDSFAENKGRLPWPVDRGVITSQFGVHKHPVLKYVTENNIGIEITSSGETPVRAVFKGEVANIISIPGANMTVIIRHGKYFTIYQNIINAKVKPGQKIETKQEIGNVYCEKGNNNKAILKFMVYEEREKLDPELWISKK